MKGEFNTNEFINTLKWFDITDQYPEIVYFGDSVLRRVADEDTDKRNMCEMFDSMIGERARTLCASISALDFGLFYYHYVRLLRMRRSSPKVIVFHLNIRSFSPTWSLNPRYQYDQEVEHLSRCLADPDYRVPEIVPVDEREEDINLREKFLDSRVKFPLISNATVREFFEIVSRTPRTYEEFCNRQKHIFVTHYLHALKPDHPRLQLFKSILRAHQEIGAYTIVYTTPVNHQGATKYVGPEFVPLYEKNVQTLSKFMEKNIPTDGGVFLDLSTFFTAHHFFHPDYTAEHLKEAGRLELVKTISEMAVEACGKKTLSTGMMNQPFVVSPPTRTNCHMRVLFVLDYDTAVSYTAPLIALLKTRGHAVDVLVFADDPNTTRELRRLGLDYGVLEMPIKDPGRYDLAVCMCHKQIRDYLVEQGVYTCVLLLSMSPRSKGDAAVAYCDCDLMLVAGEHIKEELRASGCFGEIIAAGVPRYDRVFGRDVTDEHFFLYADVGRHPAGREQRKEMLARLCHVAELFPEYKVLIKPRYTHQTRDVTAHYHGEDYYHLLREHGRVPENLRVLEEHVDLEDLVCRCSVLICFPSTCVLPAMLLGKPVLVLKGGGFNEDPPPHETFGVCSNYPYFRESGCVIDLDMLVDHLPDGLLAETEFVRREVRGFDGLATHRVANILEAVWRTVKRTTPKLPVLGLTIENCEERLRSFAKAYQDGSQPCHRVERQHVITRNKSIFATKINIMLNQSSLPQSSFKDLISFLTGWIETSKDFPIQDRELNRLQRQTISEVEHRLMNDWKDFNVKTRTGFEDLLVHVWLEMLIGDTADFKRWPQWSAIDFSTYLRNLVEHHAQDGWWPVYLFALCRTSERNVEPDFVNLVTRSVPESIARPAYGYWLYLVNEVFQIDGFGALTQTLVAQYFVRCFTMWSLHFVLGLDLFSLEAKARLDAMGVIEQREVLARHVSTVPLRDETDRYRRGSIFQWLACLDRAESDFLSILAREDTRRLHPGALYHLGSIYRQQGRLREACNALKHCLELQEDHRAAAALMGEVTQPSVREEAIPTGETCREMCD